MPSLNYAIASLVSKASKITLRHPTSAEEMFDQVGNLNSINRAISILRNEKKKDEEDGRDLKKLKKDYEETIDTRNMKIIKNKI